ncbi:MAG: PSD1 and planctomycete cytochrome C domain-containing protein [Pirellulaceae bacterium]|nr:PSD1 and planctomycete cytochrome C domain-containing protein [Pirellulaceae bacterium]
MVRWLAVLVCSIWIHLAYADIQAGAAQSGVNVDFAKDVYPILQRSCLECHGDKKQEGNLRLDQRTTAMSVVVPGDLEKSELLHRVCLPRGSEGVMPAVGEPLTKREQATLQTWIEQGASWPESFTPAGHWSYSAPQRPELAAPNAAVQETVQTYPAWGQSPIDRFVLQRLIDDGLRPSAQAPPEKLVRRLFLDLIGLPPTPAEVQAFVADPTQQRYEQLVNDLLRRPQFGERWARPWLDLARYADSHGFQRDDFRDLWAYRDWVIQALNDDMPFDQFTIEQIAGDLLPSATESQKIATGFHRCSPTNCEAGSLPEETRIEQVIDRVNTTATVWLGTTLECCQCHDHKYDPFKMKEYYQLLAFFNNTELEADLTNPKSPSSIQFKGPTMPLANAERDAKRAQLQAKIVAIEQQLSERRRELDTSLAEWSREFDKRASDAQSHPLDVVDFQSTGTTDTYKKLDDGAILLVGNDPPETDVYRVQVQAELKDVRAFRLDVLRHDSLPGKGPGRGDAKRRNFILNEFKAEAWVEGPMEGTVKPLGFKAAMASFSQAKWDVAGAIDQQAKSGWAISPEFDRSHWATFVLAEPLDLNAASQLSFTLTQQFGQARTIGCFRLTALTGNVSADSVSSELVVIAAKSQEEWSKGEREKLLQYRFDQDPPSSQLQADLAKLQKQLAAVAADTTLLMVELASPRASTIFMRGDYKRPGEPVEANVPAALHALPTSEPPVNRLLLARWLVSKTNPLVARVTVNRWWAELFGAGIVPTAEDFGIKGEPPSHPELLDWLAVEFMDSEWSMKHVLKTIVMSATYQQSSRITPELLELDDRNRLLARGPRFRMDAELVRDNALAISGLLDLKQFGPSIRPYQPEGIWTKVGGQRYEYEVSPGSEKHRRGIYVVMKRGAPYPSFMNFDATARLNCTVKRSRTNTPLQALTLLNDPVYVEAAKAFAQRIQSEKGNDTVDKQVDFAFQLCVARLPSDTERSTIKNLLTAQASATNSDDAWLSVTTALLNLHETITKD